MSASSANSAIYLTDTPEEISTKVITHAFSGGRQTMKEHRELGADLEVGGWVGRVGRVAVASE